MGLGVGGTIVLIIIILVVLAVGGTDLTNKLTTLYNQEKQLVTQSSIVSQLSPKTTSGQTVCSLRVDISATLDNPPSFPAVTGIPLQFYFNSQSVTYSWVNCYQSGTLSLVPFYLTTFNTPFSVLNSLNLAGGAGESITVQLVLNGDDGSKIDASVQPNMLQSVILPNGIFPTPYGFHLTYLINNIPQQHYQLSVYAGRNINSLGIGIPYTIQVN